VEAAIAYLQSRPDVDPDRIGGVGLSVGGEVMLQAAADSDALKAIVSEGAGVRSVREAVHVSGADKVIFTELFAITTLGTAVFASDLPPPSLTDLSAEISEPLFVIYSDRGQGGETSSRQYHDAATGPKELWVAPGGHTGAIDAAPQEYERRLVAFFDNTLLEGR
jgi:predicted acyl esterase